MELLTWEMNLRLSAFIDINLSISAIIDRVSRSTDTKHIRILRLRKKKQFWNGYGHLSSRFRRYVGLVQYKLIEEGL